VGGSQARFEAECSASSGEAGAEGEGQMTGPRPAGPLRDAELFQHRPEYPIPKRRADAEVLSGDFVVADVVPQ
jgi:hypothetical protein